MSRDDPEDGNGAPGYKVGYGKPPTEHRFAKGRSGNPKGRPARSPANQAKNTVPKLPHGAGKFIIQEAYRPVTIREGDATIELPAIQAAMRALTIAAMKGSRLSQKVLAELVKEAEAKHRADTEAEMEAALEYKQRWTDHLQQLRARGLPEPELVPHPDDIMIDFRNGGAQVRGPLTDDDKEQHDMKVARRNDAQAEVSEYAKLHRRARDPKRKQMWLEWWLAEQLIFDMINDSLPPRYKVKLVDRSYHADASREGKWREAYLADRKRRKQDRKWS